jgi:flagellar basal body-associated protein FliL
MSDDAPKKKGGKLPIIIALVAVLGGGGFFMTKGKKDAKKEPEIALGKVEVLLPDEFIVNMADGQTYIRAKVALLPKEGFVAEDLKAHDAQLSDIIIRILKSTSPRDVVTDLQITKLKRRIASEINKASFPTATTPMALAVRTTHGLMSNSDHTAKPTATA